MKKEALELKITKKKKKKTYIFMKDHEKDDRFLAAQVEKVESLGDAKAKKGGFPVAHPYCPNTRSLQIAIKINYWYLQC